MGVYEKLLSVQSELKAPKGQYNSFGKYKYRSCEDILEAAKPICKKYGLCLRLSDEIVIIGSRYYVKATATVNEIESGEDTSVTAYAREEETKKGMDGSQITGSASSYARKYALNGLFDIDDTKDPDTDEHAKVVNNAANKRTSKPQDIFSAINAAIAHYGQVTGTPNKFTVAKIENELKVKLNKSLTEEQGREIISALKQWEKEMECL